MITTMNNANFECKNPKNNPRSGVPLVSSSFFSFAFF